MMMTMIEVQLVTQANKVKYSTDDCGGGGSIALKVVRFFGRKESLPTLLYPRQSGQASKQDSSQKSVHF